MTPEERYERCIAEENERRADIAMFKIIVAFSLTMSAVLIAAVILSGS